MHKPSKSEKEKRIFFAKVRYAAKRHTIVWKRRKKSRKIVTRHKKIKKQKREVLPPTKLSAPGNFSLISNTNEILKYFDTAEKKLKNGENVLIDISQIDALSPETVALLVAHVNDEDFVHEGHLFGNSPQKEHLNKLINESGFFDHVRSVNRFKVGEENLMHKERNYKVVSSVAKRAAITGIKHVFGNRHPFDPLYNTLIECMSNTNNHANLSAQGKCLWWLYVYSYPDKKLTSYTFLDLGVGIFESAVVQDKLKKMLKGVGLYPNVNLVDDLLEGSIQSRIDKDRSIRGKGIPQIVRAAQSPQFRSFYIIANDVKIDLKTRAREQLDYPLHGTLLHWELQN